LLDCAVEQCNEQLKEIKEVLLIQDTTDVNLEKHRWRITDTRGLGVIGNDYNNLGFLCHPGIVVNAKDKTIIGLADIYLWSREEKTEEEKANKADRAKLPIEEKESGRWIERAVIAQERLKGAEKVTVIQDREGDIYESFSEFKKRGMDFVIRATHNRRVKSDGKKGGKAKKLEEQISGFSSVYEYETVVKSGKNRKKRTACLEVRYGTVRLLRPENIVDKENYPGELALSIVQVKEKAESVPHGEKAIEWKLYTGHDIGTVEAALKTIEYYKCRWMIEDLFRVVKTEGLNYEESELETGPALRKLFIAALMAAVQILKLRQAREGVSEQKTTSVFSQVQIKCMKDLMPRYEGKTEKSRNPYPESNLAWATWLIARLGGWKSFTSQRPPGVITLYEGWRRFFNIFDGWAVAKDVYKW
jgi:hypothetical protein